MVAVTASEKSMYTERKTDVGSLNIAKQLETKITVITMKHNPAHSGNVRSNPRQNVSTPKHLPENIFHIFFDH